MVLFRHKLNPEGQSEQLLVIVGEHHPPGGVAGHAIPSFDPGSHCGGIGVQVGVGVKQLLETGHREPGGQVGNREIQVGVGVSVGGVPQNEQ